MQTCRALLAWLAERWPGTVQATGFGAAIFEFGGRLFFGRPIDPAVLPFAAALILWQPRLRQVQQRRNERRGLHDEA